MKRLSGIQLIEIFGDPRPHILADGTVGASWEKLIVGHATLPAPLPLSWDRSKFATHFKCHRLLAAIFEEAMAAVHLDGECWATINDFGGCYEFRIKRGSMGNALNLDRLSLHSWGAAIDWDVLDNPRKADPKVHPRLRAIMEAHGFLWGGLWAPAVRDPMHFEFADLGRLG